MKPGLLGFDLSNPPCTQDALAAQRQQQRELLQTIGLRERRMLLVIGIFHLIGGIIGEVLWRYQYTGYHTIAATFGISALFDFGFLLWARNLSCRTDGETLMVGFMSVITVTALTVFAVVFPIALGLASLPVALWVAGYMGWVYRPRLRAEAELTASTLLGRYAAWKCAQFVAWCKADPQVAAYQGQLVALGRMPTNREYEVAREWVHAVEEQQHEADAQKACAALTQVISDQA